MKVYSVRECSSLVAGALQKDYIFKNITISGTVSNLHFHFSGVIFFSLIDEESRITCRIGKMRSAFLGRRIKNGTEILILGNIKYDKISGRPIFQVDRILSSTESPILEKLDMLKKELKASGYFDILKYDGVRAQKMGKLVYAIKCFTEALNIQEDFETMSYLVSAYTMANDLGKAEDVLNRMVEMEPDHIATRLTRVNLLFMLDKDAEVITDCLHVIELEPSNHVAYFMMAKAKKATNDVFGAIADLTRSISLKEDFADAYLLRAEILLGLGQAKEALPDVEKAIEIVPEEESSYLLRGRIHMALGDIEAANSDFQQVLDLNPFNEDACILSGQLLIEQKKYDEAIAFFDEAIETNPSFAKAYSERGRAKNLKGDKTGAFEDLKKSLELNPESEEAQKMNGQHSNFDNMYKGGIF